MKSMYTCSKKCSYWKWHKKQTKNTHVNDWIEIGTRDEPVGDEEKLKGIYNITYSIMEIVKINSSSMFRHRFIPKILESNITAI